MYNFHKIDSLDLPELQPYRTMRRQAAHREAGIFVAEGEKVVRRLLESAFGVISVMLPEPGFREIEPLLQARKETVAAFVAEKALLETLTGFSMYQGWLAVGRIPVGVPLDNLIAAAAKPRLFAAVDGLSSAENVGALVRNCAAFGAHGLLVGETSSSPYLRRAVRSSMGSVFQLPIIETPNLVAALRRMRELGVRSLAAHPHATGRLLAEADLTGDICVVFGSEGLGLSPAVLQACDDAAAIPMSATVDSLNVASAAAAFLYEVNRQRGHITRP